ncbi:protein LAZ1 [Tanacetum coccineum]
MLNHDVKSLDLDPSNNVLRDEEVVYIQAFNDSKIDEERFLKQKAKIEWLKVGDSNSAYFYKAIKSRHQRSKINVTLILLLDSEGLFCNKVSDVSIAKMTKPITAGEIKKEVCKAIQDFFHNGKLLKEINHTFIALIPKVSTLLKVTDYRPISCCNIVYKCISKILTNRIIDGIKEVVSENQSAFVLGRRISDNILITQELMHNYHLDRGPPRCAFKVDIPKAYDTMDWQFLGHILKCFGFHRVMIKWVMACVTSTSFSININGDIHGFFKGKRGLRQGDVASAKVIMESLNEFKEVSGLVPSIPKSTTFFCNVVNHVKISILIIMSFSEGELPFKYLGVPLISSRLLNKDCKILVEKARNRIRD